MYSNNLQYKFTFFYIKKVIKLNKKITYIYELPHGLPRNYLCFKFHHQIVLATE